MSEQPEEAIGKTQKKHSNPTGHTAKAYDQERHMAASGPFSQSGNKWLAWTPALVTVDWSSVLQDTTAYGSIWRMFSYKQVADWYGSQGWLPVSFCQNNQTNYQQNGCGFLLFVTTSAPRGLLVLHHTECHIMLCKDYLNTRYSLFHLLINLIVLPPSC